MPPLPGEETLTTLYADIHYYFAQPTVRPVLHRFDKASYFYIYYNSTRQTSRIEVANNPGTSDQDAFNGFLDSCRVINSHKFPTLISLVVDGAHSPQSSPTSGGPGRNADEWRLASADPRDPGKSKYRLHTLDVYFWRHEDAKLVIELLRKLLDPSQLDGVESEEEPKTQHEEAMSPVVQNLENVAITDPAYQNGKTRGSKTQPAAQSSNLPPPPPPQTLDSSPGLTQPAHRYTTSVSPLSENERRHNSRHDESPANFTPMAYNPAAPAAPEPIAHREDTPPPPDDGKGTGLAAAALNEHSHVHMPQSPGYTGRSGSQSNTYGQQGPQGLSHAPTPINYQQQQPQFGGRSSVSSGGQHSTLPPQPSSIGSSSISPGNRHGSVAAQHYIPTSPDPQSQMFNQQQQPVQTPGTQFYNSVNENNPHRPLQHIQPQYADYLNAGPSPPPPPASFAQHQYTPTQQSYQPGNPYDIHGQVYRPSETEARPHHHQHQSQGGQGRPDSGGSSSKPVSRFDQRADKVEKSMGRLFKKIEKRIG